MATYFRRLEINNWQQFAAISIDFHDRLTILTGANASGKTTILNLLARHVGWNVPSLAVPFWSSVGGAVRFFTRFFRSGQASDPEIGALTYDDKRLARLMVPDANAASYEIRIDGQQQIRCFFLPSHRAVYRYQAITQIPAVRIGKEQAFDRVWSSTRNRFFGGGDHPASYHMKEVLIAWSIFGRGNSDMPADRELLSFFEGFQQVLGRVLPNTLGFRRLSIRNMEIVIECEAGDFMLDGASGGLSAIIDLAWQVFMYSTADGTGFTVMIDEVENHLHPVMQKRVLSDFLNAFPTARFVVSTHSPLIVNSVRDAAVYALRFDSSRRVTSTRLDFLGQARTAAQVLNEVLGVTSTLPYWAEEELNDVVRKFSTGPLDERRFTDFREEVKRMGLADYLPEALGSLLDARQQ